MPPAPSTVWLENVGLKPSPPRTIVRSITTEGDPVALSPTAGDTVEKNSKPSPPVISQSSNQTMPALLVSTDPAVAGATLLAPIAKPRTTTVEFCGTSWTLTGGRNSVAPESLIRVRALAA